ncbi:PEP-CTERM sorting domain-containing protein [Pontiellaceae bacterium B12227]|nr:PEP-CTERM sorting domain-containing protein [Pontiellaceae bacterium B12227]
MKKTVLIALVSVAAISAQAGVITNVGSTDPITGNNKLEGAGVGSDNRSREVIRTDTQQYVVGQSFTLATLAPTEDYKLTDIYLRSFTGEDFSVYTDNLQIRVFSGTSGTALGTYSFDVNAFDDGSTDADVAKGDWVKFTLDSGLVLADGGSYSFLMGFDASSGATAINKWGWYRDDGGIYSGGNQFEGRNNASYSIADWDAGGGTEWSNMISDANDDFNFYVNAEVIPEPATLGLVAMVGTSILFVRRRFKL